MLVAPETRMPPDQPRESLTQLLLRLQPLCLANTGCTTCGGLGSLRHEAVAWFGEGSTLALALRALPVEAARRLNTAEDAMKIGYLLDSVLDRRFADSVAISWARKAARDSWFAAASFLWVPESWKNHEPDWRGRGELSALALETIWSAWRFAALGDASVAHDMLSWLEKSRRRQAASRQHAMLAEAIGLSLEPLALVDSQLRARLAAMPDHLFVTAAVSQLIAEDQRAAADQRKTADAGRA